ncbi:MAG TPA: tRNA (adenosine(37)-N6)-threonylcarbamoyltransferase complex dimerization subunit type 1 TsaB [Thermoanaerobaculia bacterium]|nr:tRNA (adenosine(37)-N6)-threonylcarbamoyltransferase complex dimerization subunit type 1 TsaB [Thermoanaerobaculia bacterium]
MADEGVLLAIDTASPSPAVALLDRGAVFEEALPSDRRASEDLLPAIHRCLTRAGAALGRVSRIAVCAGPGSFTGLRVGLATAWGLGRAAAIPIESVSTLEAMAEAWRESGEGRVWAALDAGKGELVTQEFDLGAARALPRAPARRAPAAEARTAAGELPVVSLPPALLPGASSPRRSLARALALASARAPRPPATGAGLPIYARASAAEEKHGAA